MLQILKRFAGQSAVYAAGDVLARGLTFALLPLYALFVTKAEFGLIGLATTLAMVLGIFLNLSLHGSVAILYTEAESEDERRRHWGSIWLFTLITGFLLTLVLDQFGEPLFRAVFTKLPFEYVRLALWYSFFYNTFSLIPQAVFRIREQPVRYVATTLLTALLTAALILYLVVVRDQGAMGYLRGQLTAAALMAVAYVLIFARSISWTLDAKWLRQSLLLTLPLVPHGLSLWALSVSDRIVLDRFVSEEQIGIYYVAYQLSMGMAVATAAVNKAWLPLFVKAIKDERERHHLPTLTTYYALIIALGGLVLVALLPIFVETFLPDYRAAVGITFWVVLGYTAHGLYYLPASYLMARKDTRWIPIATALSAAVNVSLNLLFVPIYGIFAAAVNTLISYVVLLGATLFFAYRRGFVELEWGRLGRIGGGLVALAALLGLVLSYGRDWFPLIGVAAPLVFLLGLGLSGFFSTAEWGGVRRMVRARYRVVAR